MKKLSLLCGLFIAFAVQMFAGDLTPVQEKAQRSLYAFLLKEKYDPTVDSSDNSVCFRRGGVLYWITFDGDTPILYTFHRKAYKVGNDEKSYKRKASIIAANEVNRTHKMVKLTVEEKKVEIAIQVYADKTEHFTAVFSNYFKCFENVDEDFKAAYKTALKAEMEAIERAEQEARKNISPSVLRDYVANVSFRLLDADGNEKSAYDQPLRSFNARYIQARIDFKPWSEKDTDFQIQLKVTRPDGRPIYLPGKKVTAEGNVTIQKSKKPQTIEIDQFGSPKEGFWKAGEYKVEVIESGDVVFNTTFNIL